MFECEISRQLPGAPNSRNTVVAERPTTPDAGQIVVWVPTLTGFCSFQWGALRYRFKSVA